MQDIILSSVIHVLWFIWHVRNMQRFEDRNISLDQVKNRVLAAACLTGNLSYDFMHNNITEFAVLFKFKVAGHPSRAPRIKQVTWHPPPCSWIKCNIYGAVRGSPGVVACSGIYRGHRAAFIGCFCCNVGVQSAAVVELNAAMYALEIACSKGWNRLWIEADSKLVVEAFNSIELVPWKLQNRWHNCVKASKNMFFQICHTYIHT